MQDIRELHRQIRKITKTKGAFTSDQSLLKLDYLAYRDFSKKWTMPMWNWGLTMSQCTLNLVIDSMEAHVLDLSGITKNSINTVPYLLQTRLEEFGAEVKTALVPFLSHVETDGLLITGQNPLSAAPTAKALIDLLQSPIDQNVSS